MGEFLQGVYDDFKSRIESPLFFATFVSWCFWNIEFVWFVLLGDSVGKYYKIVDWPFETLYAWVLPVITAPLFILLMPAANNLLMLCRYRLLSLFQHKVQDSKGKYNDALQLVLLEKKTEELLLRSSALDEREDVYVEAKAKLDQDSEEYEKKFRAYTLLSQSLEGISDFHNWQTKKSAYESKVARLERRLRGDVPEDESTQVSMGSYVYLEFKSSESMDIITQRDIEGYLDELTLADKVPVAFVNELLGVSEGASVHEKFKASPNSEPEMYRVKVVGVGIKLTL